MSATDFDPAEWVDLLSGVDMWHTPAVGGVPAIRMSDGPAGVRGTKIGGPASASFPCGVSLAATFDPELVAEIGNALAREARSKNVQVILAPTVNLHRSPLGGRNFESMGEDPMLTAMIASAYIGGVQSRGIACCVKHFVGNDTEFKRFEVSSQISERVLREVYLVPFEAAVATGVRAVMAAYNRLNGEYCSQNPWLLTEVLRDQWGFDGVVVSDWYGTHSTVEALRAGLDVEMPGPSRHRGDRLRAALAADPSLGELIERSVARIAALAEWTAAQQSVGDESTVDDPVTTAAIRRAAAAGMVLLKNEAALPLAPGQRLALIGPYAATGRVQGGGSARVTAHRPVAILGALRERGFEVEHRPGCDIGKYLPVVRGEFRIDGDDSTTVRRLEWIRQLVDDDAQQHELVVDGPLVVERSGIWQIGVRAVGAVRVTVDEQVVVELDGSETGRSFFGFGSDEIVGSVELIAGREHHIEVRYPPSLSSGMRGFIVGARPADTVDLVADAVDLAAASDVSIVVVGTDDDWETEGEDRESMDLPGDQDALIEAVAAVSSRTIVVVNAGSPITMPWLDRVDAVLMMWFPGSQLGAALADVLSGDAEPGGRLPMTFARHLDDVACAEHYPGDGRTAVYGEGLRIGYRWFADRGIEPQFWFGAGQGYTRFDWHRARLSGDPIGGVRVTAEISNVGDRPGHEVVQIYVRYVGDDPAVEPIVRFVASAKVHAVPGERVESTIVLNERAFSAWLDGGWTIPAGRHEILWGRHAGALSLVGSIES